MILARLAVIGAVCCTLWFNGSYAYAKAAGDAHQLAMVAVALSIDLCKCAFLPAAAGLAANGLRLRASVLVLLWPLAFGWSLYSGYSSLTTNRSLANVVQEGDGQRRARAQAAYDAATATLMTAKRSPLWDGTAACTATKSKTHQQFCDGVSDTVANQQTAAGILDATKPIHIDPEVGSLSAITGFPRESLLFWVAFAPALILELLSSFGAYAVSHTDPKPLRSRSGAFLRWPPLRWPAGHESKPKTAPVSSDGIPAVDLPSDNNLTPKVMTWKVSA